MYGPPSCCKRFEAGEKTVCVNVSGLLLENHSPGLDDDPRVSVLINRSVTKDTLSPPGFPTRRWTVCRRLLSLADLGRNVLTASRRCGGKLKSGLCFSKRS